MDQVEFVINDLKRNPESRRAVINTRDNWIDSQIDSGACLQHLQFFIREGKLHLKVLMRSNDAPEAAFMNAFAFIMLQKKVADELGVEIGTYTHRANSYHCYSRNYVLLENFINRLKNTFAYDNAYSYKDEWKELMDDEIPNILNSINKLKEG
jgi:thymidylate synthase